jgi:hypothetical protein
MYRASIVCYLFLLGAAFAPAGAAEPTGASGRSLPLVQAGKVDPAWVQVGWGGFAAENGMLRTEPDEKGLGLLVYRPEKFGNCQIKIVFRAKDARSNSGVYVRIDDGILAKVADNHPPARRGADGKLTPESLKIFQDASERDLGAWYAVHHGYEVQICDTGDAYHRTGAIYSLAKSSAPAAKSADAWRMMIITLRGERIDVELDGRRVTSFDPASKELPARKQWHEPRREPRRPPAGYLGLQNHDPGDIVWFKEIAVRPLSE